MKVIAIRDKESIRSRWCLLSIPTGDVQINFIEKMLAVMAKLFQSSLFIKHPTPRMNDANNALVGNGYDGNPLLFTSLWPLQ